MIDIDIAQTFLKVAETSSFQLAAQHLNVTQSTVSARIRVLEERLGRKVFDRSRAGAVLNAHGRAFRRYAATIVHAWEEGRRVAGIGGTPSERLAIGGEHNLWTRLLALWLIELRADLPEAYITAAAADAESLVQRLRRSSVDLAVMHQVPAPAGLEVSHLMDDELRLVTTDPEGRFEDRYVDIAWPLDDESRAELEKVAPARIRTGVDLGFSSINYMMISQGAGYLPRRLVDPYVDAGLLHAVEGMPTFLSPIYVVRRARDEHPNAEKAVSVLRNLADLATRGELPPPFWSLIKLKSVRGVTSPAG